MELKDQVCTLEQAKRLKEAGIYQNGFFMWQETGNPDEYAAQECLGIYNPQSYDHIGIASAYTVAELGEMLPTLGIKRCKSNNGHGGDYHWLEYKSQDWSDENEAKLLAKFLIYLLENKLVDVATINKQP